MLVVIPDQVGEDLSKVNCLGSSSLRAQHSHATTPNLCIRRKSFSSGHVADILSEKQPLVAQEMVPRKWLLLHP